MSNITLKLRPSDERGHADHDWLKTYHTFSFASYYDPKHAQYGPLRVINEDRVAAGSGFPLHGHSEFEIFSLILAGELQHDDSLRNSENLKRGDVQMTSTGTGIKHSEHNRNGKTETHFLQIWAKPNKSGLTPGYYTRHYSDASKRDVLLPVVAPVGTEGVVDKREDDTSGPTPIHADLYAFMSIVSPGKSVTRTLPAGVRRSYVHLAMSTYREPGQKAPADASKLTIAVKDGSSASLIEGDGIYVDVAGAQGEITFTNEGKSDAEFVLFEMTA